MGNPRYFNMTWVQEHGKPKTFSIGPLEFLKNKLKLKIKQRRK
jgi:hypothetical protein